MRKRANLSGSIGLGANEALLSELAALDEQRSRLALERGRALLAAAMRERTRQWRRSRCTNGCATAT